MFDFKCALETSEVKVYRLGGAFSSNASSCAGIDPQSDVQKS